MRKDKGIRKKDEIHFSDKFENKEIVFTSIVQVSSSRCF